MGLGRKLMGLTATTVGGYLRDLPADRRVAMARVCSMIRRSARGVRESMRYGLAFYELQGPLFALESTEKDMTLFVAEPEVVERYKDTLPNVLSDRSAIRFTDLNRIPLDSLEKIVRDSVSARRERLKAGSAPTQKELLILWKITEEDAKAPPPVVKIPMGREEEEVAEVAPVVDPEPPKPSGEILRAPTFQDPSMTATSRPKVKAKAEEKVSSEEKKAVAKKTVKRKGSADKDSAKQPEVATSSSVPDPMTELPAQPAKKRTVTRRSKKTTESSPISPKEGQVVTTSQPTKKARATAKKTTTTAKPKRTAAKKTKTVSKSTVA